MFMGIHHIDYTMDLLMLCYNCTFSLLSLVILQLYIQLMHYALYQNYSSLHRVTGYLRYVSKFFCCNGISVCVMIQLVNLVKLCCVRNRSAARSFRLVDNRISHNLQSVFGD